MKMETTVDRPGMLLGKIQSGKTRTFIGATALSFDNGYDITIVLTKGTRALAQQTYERLKTEFDDFKYDDVVQIFDIMSLPDNLANYELDQKLLIVAKKQKDNLSRLKKALFETYPMLAGRKILIIDDEADFASVGFSKTNRETTEINKIAGQIDDLRKELSDCDFLQVTATPYSLYLQPETLRVDGSNIEFKPVKPAFTELVPVPDAYIGGDYYFEESEEDDSIASYIYESIELDELHVLKKQDRRRFKIEEALTSYKIKSLRNAVLNFIVGGVIRQNQEKHSGNRLKKYSFIVHTEQAKQAHEWQEEIVIELKEQLRMIVDEDPVLLSRLIRASYENMKQSLLVLDRYLPDYEEVKQDVITAIRRDFLMITKVNSEKDVNQLLDDTGQLKLRTPLNIFIGGQILDRGITIGNLIGFYYGRNPKTFQQDTVLQHSRMFGYRPLEDLAVTRFYTTKSIYDVMEKIHEFDSALRNAFEKGGQEKGVVFIQKDTKNQLIPCSPNKLLLSKTTTLKPYKRILPIGFQTGYKTYITDKINKLDSNVNQIAPNEEPVLVDIEEALKVVNQIKDTFDTRVGETWDEKAFISSLEYLSRNTDSQHKGKVWIIVRKGRNIGRIRQDGRYEDAPDTPKGSTSELRIAKQFATDIPALILLRQNGDEEKGWRGCPFWWPVLVTPGNTQTVIFASEANE
ncbi:hypothetical protein KS419_02150 [Bacillus tamaricis]|uniref:Putative endonuclease Z1 domain-containing protein n=2 Tax=Evansella tamaricis TaxID=2069301 RepID=A0ABS6JDX8_9BACI|nr:hypothetical protein [Evansella tamaricis]